MIRWIRWGRVRRCFMVMVLSLDGLLLGDGSLRFLLLLLLLLCCLLVYPVVLWRAMLG